jgi:small ligand-binding sensory domain FIST
MKWASAISVEAAPEQAVEELLTVLEAKLDLSDCDLVVAFVSPHHRAVYGELAAMLRQSFGEALLLGCSAGGVLGGGHEIERQAAISVTAACLPQVHLTPLVLDYDDLPRPGAPREAWEARLGVQPSERPVFILLPDPFTFDPQPLIRGLDRHYPESAVVGGLASGARLPGHNALFLGDALYDSGAVGVALTGNVVLDTIVAQGCRPIGQPMFVTSCEGGLLRGLDGRAPSELLVELYRGSDERDRELFRHSLFLGVGMRDDRQSYRQGDFLIRNIVGLEPDAGLLQVAAPLHEGQVVQFHLRDAETSTEDLATLLAGYRGQERDTEPAGALLFSCLGRGIYLYGEPDHDTRLFREALGDLPLGGFFCNGEIGPVQGRNFLHGYTSSFGVFRPKVA